MTASEAMEWAKLGITVGQWILGLILRLAEAESEEDVRRVQDVIPTPLRSTVALAAERLQAQRELAVMLGLDTDAEIRETTEALTEIDWPDAGLWARALHGRGPVPVVEIPTNPFEEP